MLNILTRTLKYVVVLISTHLPYCNRPVPPSTATATATAVIAAPKREQGDTARYIRLTIDLPKAKNPGFYFTDLPYDKTKGLMLMKDDGGLTDYTIVFKILSGGIVNGKQYPGFFYTDGTGKKIGYKYSFAINPNEGHTTDLRNVTSWAQINEIIDRGHGYMNHSLFHGGTDKLKAIKDAEKNMWTHTHYRMTEIAVPGNDEGFVESGLQLGYNLISSEFGEPVPDGNNDPGNENMTWGSYIPMTQQNFNKVLISRTNLGDQWNSSELKNAKAFVDYVFNNPESDRKLMGAAFSHGPFGDQNGAPDNFYAFLSYIENHPANNDGAWITSSKDLMDYEKTKAMVKITAQHYDAASGKYEIILDMGNVDPNVITRNLSLKITGGRIISAKVKGATEVTCNPSSGLINIYKTDRSRVIAPDKDPLPPQLTSIIAKGKTVQLGYDKPVVQTRIQGYEIPGNKVLSMTGSGKIWELHLQSGVQPSQTLFYRMQRGNARQADNASMRVCTYAGSTIK